MNFSWSEWLLIGAIFLIVVAAPRVPRLGERVALWLSGGKDPADPPGQG